MSTEPPPSPDARLCALIRRELGAADVQLLEVDTAPPAADNALAARLADGRYVVATFFEPPGEREVLGRRLDMLASTFTVALSEADSEPRERSSVAKLLHEELRALATRGRACDALVLDGQSPVVWSSATGTAEELDEALRLIELCRSDFIRDARDPQAANTAEATPSQPHLNELPAPLESSLVLRDVDQTPEASLWAIQEVRKLPEMAGLRRGRLLHHLHRGDEFGYLAKSFAGIYLLVLVFDSDIDEIRAERSLAEALPRIERLVLALPPRDPEPGPQGNVVSFRRRR